jgi:hypothetical protein
MVINPVRPDIFDSEEGEGKSAEKDLCQKILFRVSLNVELLCRGRPEK